MNSRRRKQIVRNNSLNPVIASAAIQRAYQKKLADLVQRMSKSVIYWLKAEYRKQLPVIMAQDALPSVAMQAKLDKVMKKWREEFNADSERIATWFVGKSLRYVNISIQDSLRKFVKQKGIGVKMRMTRAEQDAVRSLIIQNVNLIKSIPSQYFTQVEGLVQRSVQAGRDMSYLTEELEKRSDITHRRAVMISRDQNNKVTEQLSMEKHKSLGITHGIWLHTSGSKQERETHAHQLNGKVFNLSEGLFDPAENKKIMPAELPNCRCTYRAILPMYNGLIDYKGENALEELEKLRTGQNG